MKIINFIKKYKHYFIAGLIVLGVVLIDQISKLIILLTVNENEIIRAIPLLFNITLAFNKAAGFGWFGEDVMPLYVLIIIRIVIIIVLLFFLKDFSLKKNRLGNLALCFITGGAIGNVIDNLIQREGVVDFIQFAFWQDFPIFNLADSFLTIGVIMLAIHIIFFYDDRKKVIKETDEHKQVEGLTTNEGMKNEAETHS